MRIGIKFCSFVLPAILTFGVAVVSFAQSAAEAGKAPSEPTKVVAPAVPADVQQKARTYKGSAVPPKSLQKQADGHWTPYTPPEKAEGKEWYTIVKGDTLSQLAQAKLGTWLLWPQIWDQNPYIKDAHWIYPGDPLLLPKPQVVSEAQPVEELPGPKVAPAAGVAVEEVSPQPPINAYDVYCSGFISKTYKRAHLTILSSQKAESVSWAKGDVVYLNEGKIDGVEPGMVYQVLRWGQTVSHPITGREIGRWVRRVGQVKVLAVQQHTSIAEITESCDEIYPGNNLVPWKAIPIPWDVKKSETLPLQLEDTTSKLKGRVVWSEDRLESTGDQSVIYIDMGSREQLIPGDKIWIYRYPAAQGTLIQTTHDLFRQQKVDVGVKDLFRGSGGVGTSRSGAESTSTDNSKAGLESEEPAHLSDSRVPKADRDKDKGVKAIPMYIGEGVVLTTEPNTACVKVIKSALEIHFGDWVMVE